MKQRLFTLALLLGPLAWLFGGALTGDEMFAFRDAAHYYYPYYQFVAEQWADGIPLWNTQENMGQPLLADATAAVLYPGKLIFALPFAYATNYKLYIVAHVLFAAITAFIAARGFATSAHAATICALSYAFSGSVLFQYCNVIFLVGAAWLPLAMLATQRMLSQRSYRWAAGLAAVLAMMIFGGDPQMAYHVMLIAALYAVATRYDGLPRPSSVDGLGRPSYMDAIFRSRLALLLATGVFAFILAAVQILPSAQWSRGSTRAASDTPRNIYEWAATGGEHDFLLGQLGDGHHTDSYNFSVGPWHAAGYLWPNCFGQVFPVNTRWIRALPAEDRTWTPTLYMGLLPLLLALSQLRLRRPRGLADSPTTIETLRPWLTYTVAFALLAALGWYSFGWIASEIYHAIYGANADPLPIGWPFGGVYWLMQTVLPGYVYFRYPAKWLVIAAMGLSLLAAGGWDQWVASGSRFVTRGLLAIWLLSMALLLVSEILLLVTPFWRSLSEGAANDALFGPLDVEQSSHGLLCSCLHTAVVAGLLGWLARRMKMVSRWTIALILLVTAIDLSVAQRGLISTTPLGGLVTVSDSREIPIRAYRRGVPPPTQWANESSEVRMREIVERDQRSHLPKRHLLVDMEIINSSGSLSSVEHEYFVREVARRKMLAWAGTQFVLDDGRQVLLDSPDGSSPLRVEIAHEVRTLPPLAGSSPRDIARRTKEVLDLIQESETNVAVVETNQRLPEFDLTHNLRDTEVCEISKYQAARVQLHATLNEDGLVILRDTFAPGWTCEVTNRETGETRAEPILRTNRVMRGVWLSPGDYDIVLRYRPATFRWGAVISAIGWLAIGAYAAWLSWRRVDGRPTRFPSGFVGDV